MIITSSLKDVMTLDALGFTAIAPQSENAHINEEFKNELKSRFDHIVIFFDNDDPGIHAAVELNKSSGFRWFTLPNNIHCKDISDAVEKIGSNRSLKILKKKLSKLLREDDLPF